VATRMSSLSGPSGYELVPLRGGADFTLYRGRQHGNPSPVLAIAPAAQQPSPQTLRRLEHEYSLAAELDSAWAAKPLALTRHEGRTILLLHDSGGEPLDGILERNQGQPLDLTRALRIAIGLTTALGQVHRHGLIHKDIKPENVLVDDTDSVWLTGFGIASRLPRERQPPAPPEIISGTLAYMAPEQTGRMNRSVDARSDFYSLGVTLYLMLTGTLPFDAADPLEWVHCHIARRPTPPRDRAAVPEPLSAIVMKLLAKNAEDRYQTALGVEADLRKCFGERESRGCIEPFQLGTHDVPSQLLIPEKLYGREREVDALLAAFERVVVGGRPELVLVSGYSGIGKSAVVDELRKSLVPPRGLFASGKFDQYKRDIPYATLAQAFQTLVRQILVKSQAEMDQWRYALADAVGPNGHPIINLVPELELIIGEQPPLADLPPKDAQNRFQTVLLRLLNVFARKEHPLALFLDDLQWADSATLDFLEYLFIHSGIRYLLVIGAYRENEVSQGHPLARAFDTIRAGDVRVQEIVLAPLDQENTETLVAEALHCQRERAQPLAQLLMEKTGGNPFFTIRFMTALTEEGLLVFDTAGQFWRWDTERIREKNYSDNVVHLMTDRLKSLPTATREALKELACLGNIAEIRLMQLIRGETAEALHATLWEAAYAGIVFRSESAYKFLHDSIQEAAYALIPEELRADRHLRIARLLVANLTPDELGERLFEIANQFNRSATLLTDPAEASQVAAIHLRAGRRAKASGAYESAHAHLMSATALLNEYNWANQYDSTFETWVERAECEFLVRNDDQSKAILVELLERARSIADQAAVYRLRVLLHITRSEIVEAVACARLCLRLFAIEIPQTPTQNQVQAEFDALWRTLGPRQIEELVELPLMRNHKLEAAMRVLAIAVEPCYFIDLNQFCVLLFRITLMSIENGISGPTAYACAALGAIMGDVFHRHRDGYRFSRLACDLVEKYGFIEYQARVYLAMSLTAHWTEPIGSAIEFNRLAYKRATESGDLTFAVHANHQYLKCLLLRNDSLDVVWRESERVLDAARDAEFRDAEDLILNEQRFVAAMQGRTPAFSASGDPEGDEEVYEATLTDSRMPLMVCLYWTLKLKARFLFGDLAGALEALPRARSLVRSFVATIGQLDYSFYSALTVTALFESGSDEERSQWREHLAAQRDQLREWAETYPPTFADKYTLVSAEIARIEGRDVDAMRLYEQAIHLTRENGFVQNEALALEVAARFYAVHGVETVANTYLRHARNCYDRWGAKGKVAQLDARHPRLQEEATPASFTATIGTPVRQLDVESVVKASQALSSEIVLPRLIETLMRLAVEHAGAERGLLILLRGDEPQIEAEVTTGHERVAVTVRRTAVTPSDLPQSALHYVIRTRQRVLLDDASVRNLYSEDEYLRQKRTRSVLCVPIVTQTKLVGALYLENNLTPRAFTSDRVTVLQLLASQAAISLENAGLYFDLQREGQNFRLIVDSVPGFLVTMTPRGEVEFGNQGILDYTGWNLEQLTDWRPLLHPDECEMVATRWFHSVETGDPYDIEHRVLGADGVYRWFVVRGLPARDAEGRVVRWYILLTNIDERKKTHEKLQRSEAFMAQGQQISQTGSFGWSVAGEELYWSEEIYRILEYDPATSATFDLLFQRIHPGDRGFVRQTLNEAAKEKTDYDIEHRLLMKTRSAKAKRKPGNFSTCRRCTSPNWGPTGHASTPIGRRWIITALLWRNGRTPICKRCCIRRTPNFVNKDLPGKFQSGSPFEYEARLRRKDGQYRWFHYRFNPMSGRARAHHAVVCRRDRYRRSQAGRARLQEENVALREEIDKASMFEEIVGTSAPLKKVLSRISKVAPTDSSVLITGETGTGKELVARAIHRRSRRSSHAFVSVNCAVIPRDLIASELFGHEKGAFTGATQRRLGRFELAEKGTIFLDEVGELPAETQIALLRVLQEHEFERIGGTGSIRTDVRVIAATNRDLEAAIEAGKFRSDLFYRLNVFPIEMPPLRERREDIPLLVTYFLNRYARKAGRHFTAVDKKSLDLLQSYAWPGNIRELQNVIERSVIVSESQTFSVDESWLSRRPSSPDLDIQPNLFNRLPAQEKALIEAALRECGGRVYGPSGAAARLGIPRTTLESKIKSLKINKHRFKGTDPLKDS
jgi:PAS domain S-box-containing protein